MECKDENGNRLIRRHARIDLTRMECKVAIPLASLNNLGSIDLTRMECKAIDD